MNLYRKIPKKDKLLSFFDESYNKRILNYLIDNELEFIRTNIKNGKLQDISESAIIENVKNRYSELINGTLKYVINATGIVLHTNLGRAPISEKLIENIIHILSGYSNLEYNLEKGERGERYHHVVEYLRILTGCEDALIVNNNAAAVFLINNTFNRGKEVLISRSELVEIGGSFRIPEVIKNSGAILKEVGTTNKTKVSDYESNISENTSMIMKVHKSNYSIVGFFEEVDYKVIPEVAKKYNLLSYCDLGSGSLLPIENCNEPLLQDLAKYDYDLISASGDKLLGAVQAGIIIGKKHLINELKKNHLLRMLRVDKLTLSILQETLKCYILGNTNEIKSLSLFAQDKTSLLKKAKKLEKLLKKQNISNLILKIEEVETYTGGGSCPMSTQHSIGLILNHNKIKPNTIEKKLRDFDPPIICRIQNDSIILDLRTIFDSDLKIVANGIKWALSQ
ncbi:L-seryl-tRNA(Sec) selenium transferase [Deferribacter desulfuricans SSM1]|uniref:L-seryl-tRNA(Sec) selenium transferase n=1 Tax=Deferribacter desulfuricans (strain DSM 14783 / JCM 11476 / NBRC 101012 / SSM1) TaxID=639282 RepID=D3PB08_DEFDS|nr:L-seryl-tRNA(Sec) selenium transferase [Deferribacter desulfuricans]BAI79781.1 L-seryl-tRNA(Sec) selenium transferase [Deferribacter desulfuricans SSM1]